MYISKKMYSWEYFPITIREFFLDSANIECNPIWQRPNVSSVANSEKATPSKQQSIMQSIIDGIDIGEIKLCKYKGRKSSIDGGNRKRAILDFLNNRFKLHKSSSLGAKLYRDLPEDVKESIMNYTLRFIQYGEMTDSVISKLFRSTNNTTHVNHQEYLNSYGMNPIACLVRETVREFDEIGNTKHPLFKCSAKKNGEIEYEYLAFDNKRLFLEEVVARILCRVVHGETFGIASDLMLEKMYIEKGLECENDPKLLDTYSKKLTAALDFILNVAKPASLIRGKGITKRQASMIIRLYFHFKEKYGEFRVPCYEDFWKAFSEAFSKFDSRNPTRKETFREGANGTGQIRVVSEAFAGNYTSFDLDNSWKVKKSLEWLLEEFDPLDVIVPLDAKRCFSREEIEKALIDQKFKCYVDGKALTMKEAAGAHKKAWSKGGKTVRKNLVAVRSVHNKQSGSMDIDTYKKAMRF